ncbi:MAG: MerR family transcriptional regulator [Limnohabitans sp.]
MAALSGVPVSTLRVWEARYAAFAPGKSEGRHRLYNDTDVLRAGLLRQLTESGHAISTIAHLDAPALSALLHQQRSAQVQRSAQSRPVQSVTLAVVDLSLAARLQSQAFAQRFAGVSLRISDTLEDLAQAREHPFAERPDILLVRVNSLHLATQAAIRRLAEQLRVVQVIVLYSFAQEALVQALKHSGMLVRREPVTDAELADLLGAMLLVDPAEAVARLQPAAMIPPRLYSDQTLARVAGISTNVLCECPRHVAELISQLASFEQYSQECLNNTVQDAQLHAYLSAISGSARALFERALERVAQHEGIVLEVQARPAAARPGAGDDTA